MLLRVNLFSQHIYGLDGFLITFFQLVINNFFAMKNSGVMSVTNLASNFFVGTVGKMSAQVHTNVSWINNIGITLGGD